MDADLQSPVLAVSIDVDSPLAENSLEVRLSHDAIVKTIAPLLARHQVSASWTFADPANSPALKRLAAVCPRQEIALIGQRAWAGSTATRAVFAQELSRRVEALRALGHETTTLTLIAGESNEYWDLVIKQGLTAICLRQTERGGARPTSSLGRNGQRGRASVYPQPWPIRFGLWGFPVSMRFPTRVGLLSLASATLKARQGIDGVIAQGGVFHLKIDGLEYCSGGHSVQRALEKILQHAARRRAAGQLRVLSLSGASAYLSRPRQATPAQSILRRGRAA